mmetsp:Transcript_28358/g.42861  ORF Transcript_28358/g.42861 Transcript_28358/m.42861 type:complete len:202 (+) Transcript_28358:432-1037(+)
MEGTVRSSRSASICTLGCGHHQSIGLRPYSGVGGQPGKHRTPQPNLQEKKNVHLRCETATRHMDSDLEQAQRQGHDSHPTNQRSGRHLIFWIVAVGCRNQFENADHYHHAGNQGENNAIHCTVEIVPSHRQEGEAKQSTERFSGPREQSEHETSEAGSRRVVDRQSHAKTLRNVVDGNREGHCDADARVGEIPNIGSQALW